VVALLIFTARNRIPLLGFADRLAVCVPIGLGLGRIANFINGELWGRAAPEWLPWAMVFPNGGPVPRHPSEIYQALLEGLVLFIILYALSRSEIRRARFGWLTGAFLVGYGIARIFGEFFREPDAFLGYLPGGVTMGQVLCIPMLLVGAWLMARARPVAVLPA
jgi:phosphatidylglycerol:prolipoprotein diacylglycerol transferase